MRILHTSDWHIGRTLFDYSLLEDQRYFFQQLFHVIRQYKVDVLVVSGDLYDRSAPSAEAVALLNEVFNTLINELHIPVLAIAGNHDSPRRIDYGTALFETCGLYLAGSVQKTIKKVTLHDEHGPVHFFLLPYFVPHEIRLLLENNDISGFSQAFAQLLEANREQIDYDQRNLLIAHGFFMNNKSDVSFSTSENAVGSSELTDLSPAKDFDYIALGHLHHGQNAGLKQAWYCGSPLKYSVSGAGQQKKMLLVDLDEQGLRSVTEVPVSPLHDLKVLQGTMEELLQRAGDTEDYIFAQLTDGEPVLHAMSRLRAVYPRILGLSFPQNNLSQPLDSRYNVQEESLESLFLRFYEDIYGETVPENRRQIIHSILDSMEKEQS